MSVTIVSVNDLPFFDRRGEARIRRVLTYTVDDQGPFLLEVPIEEFSAETVRARLEVEAARIRALTRSF